MFKKMLVTLFVSLSLLATASASFAQGRKMGLFVGINEYQDGINQLNSCVKDAANMQDKLVDDYGFSKSNTTLLTDEEATRQGILKQLRDYEAKTSKGDLFVMFYSGHGSLFPDALSDDKDEADQIAPPKLPAGYYDSTLVPVDAKQTSSGKAWGNFILDDEINAIFSRFTAKGVQVIFISDSCHSGTLARSLNLVSNTTDKYVSPVSVMKNTDNWKNVVTRRGRKSDENFDKLFLVVGSSLDTQYSIDQGVGRMSLFTENFIGILDKYKSERKTFTYNMIEREVKPLVELQSDGRQTPRLDARFFDGKLLDQPIFSLVAGTSNASNNTSGETITTGGSGKQVRIVVKVMDENKKPVSLAAFGVFKRKAILLAGQVKKEDALMLGRTDEKGLFDSEWKSQTFAVGTYQIKVVKEGYKAFIQDMPVTENKNGVTGFVFQLVKE